MSDNTLQGGLSIQNQEQQQSVSSSLGGGGIVDTNTVDPLTGGSFDVNNPVHVANLLYQVNFITDISFYILLIATVVFVWIKPNTLIRTDFYRKCFATFRKGIDVESGCCHVGPPRLWVFTVIWYLMNTMITIGGVLYAWGYRHPVTSTDTNYYLSIIYLFFVFCCFKYIWHELFWNYHHYKHAFGISVIICILLTGIALTLTILYALQHAIVSAVMFAIVTVWLLCVLCWNAFIFYCYCKKPELWCECHRQHYHYSTVNSMQYSQTNYQNVTYTQEGGGGTMMQPMNTTGSGGMGYPQHKHHQQHQHQQHPHGHHKQHHHEDGSAVVIIPVDMSGSNQTQYNPNVQYQQKPMMPGGGGNVQNY